jgi:hypothetical protein
LIRDDVVDNWEEACLGEGPREQARVSRTEHELGTRFFCRLSNRTNPSAADHPRQGVGVRNGGTGEAVGNQARDGRLASTGDT